MKFQSPRIIIIFLFTITIPVFGTLDLQPKNGSWASPIMNPHGQNIANYIKTYYKIGNCEIASKYVVDQNLKTPSAEFLQRILSNAKWGYDFKLKNCVWLDSHIKFKLTIETKKMTTVGIETYYGIVLRDTARLLLNTNGENPFGTN